MDLVIRPATERDYPAVCTMSDELDALHRGALPHLFRPPDGPARALDYYRSLLADANVALLIAEMGEEAVGFCHAILRDAPLLPIFVPRRFAVVDSIVVKAGHRESGIGAAMMRAVEAWSLERGAVELELNVYEFNRGAIAFYERLGFETMSRRMAKRGISDTDAALSHISTK